jgi:hypothetical protein
MNHQQMLLHLLRLCLFLICLLGGLAAWPAVEIVGLPPALDAAYDLTWTLRVNGAADTPFELLVEQTSGRGCRLAIAPDGWRWEGLERRQGVTAGGSLALEAGRSYAFRISGSVFRGHHQYCLHNACFLV